MFLNLFSRKIKFRFYTLTVLKKIDNKFKNNKSMSRPPFYSNYLLYILNCIFATLCIVTSIFIILRLKRFLVKTLKILNFKF